MKISPLILFFLLISAPLFAQENEAVSDYERQLSDDIKYNYYSGKEPRDIWNDYLSMAPTLLLISDVQNFKNPYLGWGVEEILKRDLSRTECVMFLSSRNTYETVVKDMVFDKCIEKSYTVSYLKRIEYLSLGKYKLGIILKILENPFLSNDDLIDLINISPPEYKERIASKIDLNTFESESACLIFNLQDRYLDFFQNMCNTIKLSYDTDQYAILSKIFMK